MAEGEGNEGLEMNSKTNRFPWGNGERRVIRRGKGGERGE